MPGARRTARRRRSRSLRRPSSPMRTGQPRESSELARSLLTYMGAEPARDPVLEKGLELFRLMGSETPAVFDRKLWAGRMMERVIREPALKVPLFRFVDV